MEQVLAAPLDLADRPRKTPWIVTWLTWPLILVGGVGAVVAAMQMGGNVGAVSGAVVGAAIVLLVALEIAFPLDRRWKMTWRSFFGRDLKYFIVGGGSIAATNALFAAIGVVAGRGHVGPVSHWPLYLGVPASILAVDFVQYWQHRWSHEGRDPVGRFLWSAHVAHHLPQQVYVLMHPAGHPINGFIVRGLATIIPLYVLGASADAIVLTNLVIGLQGLVSHCNLDMRAGWFNHIFVGAELHRYHHSADPAEGRNYAVCLSILDQLFGTFVYRPAQPPARLGVDDPSAYPASNEVHKVMLIPFLPRRAAEA
jgi:sterol desaturase/sphingolipid hydroxylase (fatty acid hydroxylase superfamily)